MTTGTNSHVPRGSAPSRFFGGVAAVALASDFAGNEICPEAVDISRRRLVEHGAVDVPRRRSTRFSQADRPVLVVDAAAAASTVEEVEQGNAICSRSPGPCPSHQNRGRRRARYPRRNGIIEAKAIRTMPAG